MPKEKIIPWEKLPITNTFMFNKVMTSDLDACRGVIETLLGIKISRIECVQDERTVEVDALDKGMAYSELKENYTLFLCPFDLFGRGLPVYTFENTCQEEPEIKLNDRTLKVFYNFERYEMDSDEDRRRLLEFFSSGKSASKLTDRLNVILNELRHGSQKWRQPYMTLEMMLKERHDDGRDEGRTEGIAIGEKRGRAEGITEGKIETARNMLKNGLSYDLVIKCTGISEQQMKGLL